MRAVEQRQHPAGRGAELARLVIAAGLVASVGEQPGDGEHVVAVAEHRAAVAGQEQAARPAGRRARSSHSRGTSHKARRESAGCRAENRRPPARPRWVRCGWAGAAPPGREQSARQRRAGALFVAADATGRFAGLHRQEALHAFDRKVVFIQRHEEETAQGGQFQVGRAVRLDRHGADDAFEREGAAVADRVHARRCNGSAWAAFPEPAVS